MPRLSDLDVYRELVGIAGRLDAIADDAENLRARTALKAVATMIRKVSSALFKASF